MIKLFGVLLGFFLGFSVYCLVGYMFTKKMPIGKKYKLEFFIFFILFILTLILYIYTK
ncbi:MAG: hypothetical protein ACK4F0_01620 [Candidatus Ratteibacteria bacterium]